MTNISCKYTKIRTNQTAKSTKIRTNHEHATVEKTAIGWVLVNQQQRMLQLCPEMKILADKVMPNHHHIVLQVMRTMPRSIKEVVRGYMQGCKAEARKLGYSGNLYDAPPYYRVLTHKGQLHAMLQNNHGAITEQFL